MYCLCRLCCSMYCLCVNVYCTTATGCQPNCSYIYHIIYHTMKAQKNAVHIFSAEAWNHSTTRYFKDTNYATNTSLSSYSTTNKMHLLSQIIYSCNTLYVFRTVFPYIIRSSKLRIQQRCMSNSCCYRLR